MTSQCFGQIPWSQSVGELSRQQQIQISLVEVIIDINYEFKLFKSWVWLITAAFPDLINLLLGQLYGELPSS
jgi:hypothetical protein